MDAYSQPAFDSLYDFCQRTPGAKLSERSFEWDRGVGNRREVHLNQLITVEGEADGRPFMIIFQSDPPEGRDRGLELFLSAMQVPVDLKIRPRPLFAWLIPGRVKVGSEQLKYLLFTAPRAQRGLAAELLTQPDLDTSLAALDWDQVCSVELQQGAGVSMCFRTEAVYAVSHGWLQTHLEPLVQLLLVC